MVFVPVVEHAILPVLGWPKNIHAAYDIFKFVGVPDLVARYSTRTRIYVVKSLEPGGSTIQAPKKGLAVILLKEIYWLVVYKFWLTYIHSSHYTIGPRLALAPPAQKTHPQKNQSPSREGAVNPDAWKKDFYMVTPLLPQIRSQDSKPQSKSAVVRRRCAGLSAEISERPSERWSVVRAQARTERGIHILLGKVQRPVVVPRSGSGTLVVWGSYDI